MHSAWHVLAVAAVVCAAGAQTPVPEDPTGTLKRGHPRLIADATTFGRVKTLIAKDARARAIYDRLVAEADKTIAADPVHYELIGPRLLDKSRRALDRVYTLSLVYRVSGDKRYRDRAVKEMRAAAAFKDWNPSHFLDAAEMTHAFAIGYDWLYSSLTAEERAFIKQAIVEKGLNAALPIYKENRSWTRVHHNWNQVCNGGIGIGALAVADEEPELARYIIREALKSLPLAMSSYAPDGGWNEGPGYWHYATRYNVYFLAALETALGTDFGLSTLPGFDRAGHFRVYFSGPSNRTFNYADAGDSVGNAEEMFWLARRFKQPVYAWQQHQQLALGKGAHALDLVWFEADAKSPAEAGWPLNALFKGVQTAFLRSSWDPLNMLFIGIKGGDNKANHSHLDLGQFVLDYGSTRFATDLGPDNYNLPQYFGKLRWTYYRLNTESHNTVLIENGNQDPKAEAPVTAFDPSPDAARVVIDMSAANPNEVSNWTRTLEFAGGKTITLRDQIVAKKPVEALWGMVTEADVSLTRRQARLTRGGRAIRAEILSPADASFDVVSTQPPMPQRQNEGTRKLVVRLPGRVESVDLTVAFTPEP